VVEGGLDGVVGAFAVGAGSGGTDLVDAFTEVAQSLVAPFVAASSGAWVHGSGSSFGSSLCSLRSELLCANSATKKP
jgi:hypothetical protein